jgi:hypothetical protein
MPGSRRAAHDRLPDPAHLPTWTAADLQHLLDTTRTTPDSLLLLTAQPAGQYARLRAVGTLTASWAHIDPDLAPAYQWMAAQMRANGLDAHQPPIWAWLQPDAHTAVDSACPDDVLLLCHLPAHQALLSDFTAWHHVLNQTWCPPPHQPDAEPPDDEQASIRASWRHCLRTHPAPGRLQAALPALDAQAVLAAGRPARR